MYNVNNIRALKKIVKEMNKGDKIYINSINLSVNVIEQLREFVKGSILLPDEEQVKEVYKDVVAVMSGKTIIPQMEYIRQ